MDQYTLQLTRTGVTPVDCAAGGAAAVAWGETQIGAKYAAVSPYRFGTPGWPGGTRCARDTCWTYDTGTTVFDCSGFVISAWQQAGIDFTTQHIYSSQDFLTNTIPDADRNALQPGDIAVYRPDAEGIGHVVLIHDITNGNVHTIESSSSKGVHIGVINWARVSAIKRPTAPTT